MWHIDETDSAWSFKTKRSEVETEGQEHVARHTKTATPSKLTRRPYMVTDGDWISKKTRRSNRRTSSKGLDIDDVLYLATRAGISTRKELQQQIMTSPSFSPDRNPLLLENMFSVASVPGMTVPAESASNDWNDESRSRLYNSDHEMSGAKLPKYAVSQARVARLDNTLKRNCLETDAAPPPKTTTDESDESRACSKAAEQYRHGSDPVKDSVALTATSSVAGVQESEAPQKIAAGIELLDPLKHETFVFNGVRMLAYSQGRGTNKRATAHVVLRRGSGRIILEGGASYVQRFRHFYYRFDILKPFLVTDTCGAYDVYASLRGGGPGGQSSAMRLAVARALALANPAGAAKLRAELLLYEDLRQRWPKQPMRYGARSDRKYRKR